MRPAYGWGVLPGRSVSGGVIRSAWACIVVRTAGLGVLTSAVVSLVRLKRSARPC
ncbi:hypothetical protein GCM10010495_60590 [Kitasatospora herbaricolor]|nr:hypothetical protein GCM10010495_60590 [Kitasatospora herbaricolor]